VKKKILVTGANGFLGKNIIKEFSKNKDILLFALI
jgi:nucleoside-diphosphate-sugar epimerase